MPCSIDNISEGGLHITITTKTRLNITTEDIIKLEFKIPENESYESLEKVISLNCEVIWIGKEHHKYQSIGLRVFDENFSYLNFVRNLYMKKVSII